MQRRNRRGGVEDRWYKKVRDEARRSQTVPSANHEIGKRWRARYVNAEGREIAKSFDRRVDAQRWLDNQTSAIVTGTYIAPGAGTVTVGQVYQQWLAMQGHVKETTKATRKSAWAAHVRGVWQDVAVADVQTSRVRTWVGDLVKAGSESATIEHALGVLRMVLAVAVEDRRINRNPCDGVKAPPRKHSQRHYLTYGQVDELAATMARDGLVVRFLAYTGLRFGEMAALTVQDFDMLRRRINIRESATEVSGKLVVSTTKNHERRSVPFPAFLAEDLAAQMEGKRRQDFVFTAPEGGMIRINTFRRRVFNPAVEKLRCLDEHGSPTTDWPKLTQHDLRHTAASLAISGGANPKSVQRMLGHKSAALTLDTYADLFPDDLEAVADAMDRAWRATSRSIADELRTEAGGNA